MNNYPVRYAFRLDPATEAALEQIARHTFQSKASIMRRYVQEGVKREVDSYAESTLSVLRSANILKAI
jgi:predicted transcriptional regulator